MEMMWEWGIDLIVQMQMLDSWLAPMQVMTFTGSTDFFLLVLPALYWLVSRTLGVRMATLLLLTIIVGSILKIAGHGPRPYWIAPQVHLLSGPERTFGLPSIHSMNAVVMWSLLAQYIDRLWGWIVALLLIIVAGVARVYLGVHFPSDVLAGWAVGIVILALWWQLSDPVGAWIGQRSETQQLLSTAIVSIGVVLVGALVLNLTVDGWDAAAGWPGQVAGAVEYLSGAFSVADVVTAAGFLMGMVAGLLYDRRGGATSPTGNLLQRVGQYLVGVVGVLLIWQGLDLLFALLAAEESALGYALRYVRYGLVGFWIFGLAPQVFVPLRLSRRDSAA